MEHLRNYLDIQQMGLHLLSTFIGMSEQIFQEMLQENIVP
jgi:hypothetical protein